MSPKAQVAAIAHADGWRDAFPKAGLPHPDTSRGGILLPYHWINERTKERRMELPDYVGDLNAMHEAEETAIAANPSFYVHYCEALRFSVLDKGGSRIRATATQRAEAFLRAISKWDDTK